MCPRPPRTVADPPAQPRGRTGVAPEGAGPLHWPPRDHARDEQLTLIKGWTVYATYTSNSLTLCTHFKNSKRRMLKERLPNPPYKCGVFKFPSVSKYSDGSFINIHRWSTKLWRLLNTSAHFWWHHFFKIGNTFVLLIWKTMTRSRHQHVAVVHIIYDIIWSCDTSTVPYVLIVVPSPDTEFECSLLALYYWIHQIW